MGKQRVAKESLHLRLDAATMARLAREMEHMRGNAQLMSVLGGDELTLTLVARAMVRRGLDAVAQDRAAERAAEDRLLARIAPMPGPDPGVRDDPGELDGWDWPPAATEPPDVAEVDPAASLDPTPTPGPTATDPE